MEIPIKKCPSTKWGLLNNFSIEPEYKDTADWIPSTKHCSPIGGIFSEANRIELKKRIQPWMKCIVEIGVSHHGWEESSSRVLIENKPEGCFYFGIDIADRHFITEKGTNVAFLQGTSYNVEENLKVILNQHEYIDLLHIDGDHSVVSVLTEWDYVKHIRPNGGVVAVHDTKSHPGPWCLFECIDPDCFTIERTCVDDNDYGLGILTRK